MLLCTYTMYRNLQPTSSARDPPATKTDSYQEVHEHFNKCLIEHDLRYYYLGGNEADIVKTKRTKIKSSRGSSASYTVEECRILLSRHSRMWPSTNTQRLNGFGAVHSQGITSRQTPANRKRHYHMKYLKTTTALAQLAWNFHWSIFGTCRS